MNITSTRILTLTLDGVLSEHFSDVYIEGKNLRLVMKNYNNNILNAPLNVEENDISVQIKNIDKSLKDRYPGISKGSRIEIANSLETHLTNNIDTWYQPPKTAEDIIKGINQALNASWGDTDTFQTPFKPTDIAIDPVKDLDPYVSNKNYFEYVVERVKRKVSHEDELIRLILCVGLSAFTYSPINLYIRAPTSTGKTHAVMKTIKENFPEKCVIKIDTMSPKALIYQAGGVEVTAEDNRPLKRQVKELKKAIISAKKAKNEDLVIELEENLSRLQENTKYILDLHGKILIFTEPPTKEVLDLIKTMLSHDDWESQHQTVEDQKGKTVIIRGWPAVIICSARDETQLEGWEEIKNRFIVAAPKDTKEKFREGIKLIGIQKLTPLAYQQATIISPEEEDRCKMCILYLIKYITTICDTSFTEYKKKIPVFAPFVRLVTECLPNDEGPTMRNSNHFLSVTEMLALVNSKFVLVSKMNVK